MEMEMGLGSVKLVCVYFFNFFLNACGLFFFFFEHVTFWDWRLREDIRKPFGSFSCAFAVVEFVSLSLSTPLSAWSLF